MNQPISSCDLPRNIINELGKSGFRCCKDVSENCGSIPNWPLLTRSPQSKTALELLEEDRKWHPVRTYIFQLDVLLKKVLGPGLITELTGFPGTGKTQICFHLSVGVGEGYTFFISTNKNFVIDRLREIAQKYVSNADSVLERIYCLEASDPSELLATLRFLEYWLPDHNVHLLIIDSITWPVKQIVSSESSKLVYTFLQDLRKLANVHNFTVVVTNELTTGFNMSGNYYTSSLSSSFHHIVNNRILLTKENGLFKAEALKSVIGEHLEALFSIH